MNKNKNLIVIVILLVVVVFVYFFVVKQSVPSALAPDVNKNISNSMSPKEVCYFKQEKNSDGILSSFVSVNYLDSNKVQGVINFIPEETESLVGTYVGDVYKNEGIEGYSTRLNIKYRGDW